MDVSEGIRRVEGGRVGVEGTVGGAEGHEEEGNEVISVFGVSGIDSRGGGGGRDRMGGRGVV